MIRRRRSRFAIATTLVTLLLITGGCALVLDLGDEAKLRLETEAGSTDSGGGGSDTAPPIDAPLDTASANLCGLPGSSNPVCRVCIEQQCCDISKACAADKECVDGLDCVKDCMAQVGCILGCAPGNSRLDDLKLCSSFQCTTCSPGPECADLGECATLFGDAGEEGLLRAIARGVVLDVDEQKCKSQRGNLAKFKDAEACAHP